MKKMRWIDLFQTIRRTKASWIAIVIFFLTSVSFNFGLTWSDDMLVNSFNQAFLNSHTRDVELFSFYGLDEEDLDEIRAIDGVSEAEGLRFASADLKHEGNRQRVSVRELSTDIDRLSLVEGDLPAEPDEVVMDRGWAERNGIRVGDRIELLDDGTNIGKVEYSDLTVCGIAVNPGSSCAV
ncbi:MAG: hypothetical protein IK096_05445, partial [Lachnospiraceae bacterium]|nr:hypothetical protein [Lachnospiraceae bacterium]